MNMADIYRKPNSLRSKLFGYMFLLAVALIFCVLVTMLLLGQVPNVKENYYKELDMQMSMLEKELSDYYENAVISATQLSYTAGKQMDAVLAENNLSFSMLENNQAQLTALQDELFDPLKNSLLQANMSGAFIAWDTTINSNVANAQDNRNGLYLQLDTRNVEKSTVIVYRGDTEIGKKHGAMPHRKWRLEYAVSDIPGFASLLAEAALPIDAAHRISPVMELPGTSEKAMLVTVPVIGADGTVYGLCGFELGQMHFKEFFSQPTNLSRLTCLFVPNANGSIDSREVLSCGVRNGYYFVPSESLVMKDMSHGMKKLIGETHEYVGVTRTVNLAANSDPSLLAVMIPKDDYDQAVSSNHLVMVVTILLLSFFAVVTCLGLSHRFIIPLRKSLRRLRDSTEEESASGSTLPNTGFREIDELVAFVTDKMMNRPADVVMPPYIEDMLSRFIETTSSLTPSEMNVLSLLIQGHDPKDLSGLLFVSESTAKHHVLKIYKKLDVSSRGELLLYIEMLKGCGLIDKITSSSI